MLYLKKISGLFTLFIGIVFSQSVSAQQSSIGILVIDGFLTSDVTAPVEVFGAATKKSWFSSYKVVIISATKNRRVTSEEGLTIVSDKTIYDELDLDVLILPSAYAMKDHIGNTKLIDFIRQTDKTASWMASNCSGALLLGEAGILDGKKATTWFGGEADLQKSYPAIDVQFDQNVVVDDRVITSNGGPVSYEAAFMLLEKISSKQFSNEISNAIQFNRIK
ncbi:MAG: DJ-1/PfpI family protein [Pseudomonadales bacterium]|nr:DJ-1/PfpI family protein [Pseudomonadales bacterium]